MDKTEKLWIWNWIGGGYNSTRASSRKEALAKAKAMTGGTVLLVNEKTLHVGTQEERDRLDAQYAGMFD